IRDTVMHITVVGSDRQLEETVRGLGFPVSTIPLSELSRAPSSIGTSVVILDVRGLPGVPPAVSAMRRQFPQAGIVLAVSVMDSALLLEAMRAGVNEAVADPITPDELRKVLDRVAGERPQVEAGAVYGFVGAKGGVGT